LEIDLVRVRVSWPVTPWSRRWPGRTTAAKRYFPRVKSSIDLKSKECLAKVANVSSGLTAP
jgi:hypothetical protein